MGDDPVFHVGDWVEVMRLDGNDVWYGEVVACWAQGKKFPGVLGPFEAASIGGLAGEKAWPVGGDGVERGP